MLAYKYRSGTDFHIEALKENYIWLASIETLNDPCEALFDSEYFKPQLEVLLQLFHVNNNSAVIGSLGALYEMLNKVLSLSTKVGIFSLSKTFADELMWAHYADSHKGFCIEYDVDYLIKNKVYDFILFEVIYQNIPPKIEIEDLMNLKNNKHTNFIQKIIGTKSKRWEYEEEVRIITTNSGKQKHDFRAVKGIYFGSKMLEEAKHKVMKALAGRGVQYYQIYLEEGTYKFDAKPVADKFIGIPNYLYKVSPVKEGALENALRDYEDNVKFNSYLLYLEKAIEVARRDPYCSEVIYPAFSIDKSTLNEPVIFVQHKTTEGGYDNIFYTTEQLAKLYSEIKDLTPPSLKNI